VIGPLRAALSCTSGPVAARRPLLCEWTLGARVAVLALRPVAAMIRVFVASLTGSGRPLRARESGRGRRGRGIPAGGACCSRARRGWRLGDGRSGTVALEPGERRDRRCLTLVRNRARAAWGFGCALTGAGRSGGNPCTAACGRCLESLERGAPGLLLGGSGDQVCSSPGAPRLRIEIVVTQPFDLVVGVLANGCSGSAPR